MHKSKNIPIICVAAAVTIGVNWYCWYCEKKTKDSRYILLSVCASTAGSLFILNY